MAARQLSCSPKWPAGGLALPTSSSIVLPSAAPTHSTHQHACRLLCSQPDHLLPPSPLPPPLPPPLCLLPLLPRSPAGIFERFRGILHEGEIDKRVQFMIEGLFAIRKAKFEVGQGRAGQQAGRWAAR